MRESQNLKPDSESRAQVLQHSSTPPLLHLWFSSNGTFCGDRLLPSNRAGRLFCIPWRPIYTHLHHSIHHAALMTWCLFPLFHETLEGRAFDFVLISFVSPRGQHMINTQTFMDGWINGWLGQSELQPQHSCSDYPAGGRRRQKLNRGPAVLPFTLVTFFMMVSWPCHRLTVTVAPDMP